MDKEILDKYRKIAEASGLDFKESDLNKYNVVFWINDHITVELTTDGKHYIGIDGWIYEILGSYDIAKYIKDLEKAKRILSLMQTFNLEIAGRMGRMI